MAIKLPEKDYFTFPELQKRWKCEENDLRRMIISGALVPSCVYNHVAIPVFFEQSTDSDQGDWELREVENDVMYESQDDQEPINTNLITTEGFYYLLHPWQTSPLDCQFAYFSKDRNHTKSSGQTCLMVTSRDFKKFTLDVVIKNGAAMKSEVLLLEKNNPKPKVQLDPREESSYLNIIAVLLQFVLTPMPNREFASKVIDEMLENYKDAYGISRSKLENTFAAANENLRRSLE